MSDRYRRYNISEKLMPVVAAPERFDSIPLEAPDDLYGYEVGLVFGSTWERGGLSDEVTANVFALRRARRTPSPKQAKQVIDPLLQKLFGLLDLTPAEKGTNAVEPAAHAEFQRMAAKTCMEQGYETFAGLVVSFSGRQQAAHYFYAKPLEALVMNLRRPLVDAKLDGLLDPAALAEHNIPEENVRAALNPDEVDRRTVAMRFGALTLPRALGESAVPSGSS